MSENDTWRRALPTAFSPMPGSLARGVEARRPAGVFVLPSTTPPEPT
ncbi:MAG TPA: hypothetical protein RMH85_01040 [Polyangiaceae bacterium LLY-WYZ-15_(1-7)]|nr:hypothetical protein [Polyangiaceae bacterium LLY-WYZ-15_(1-7)]HJL07047.1 hypothetical protein [Polyangiaceae bacterium LLY-WYZ-15_(1-7)]HJL23825.1 hypothetical protein [Polyangiaceae bacterium LLY-WYZ-15_(1-7)]HJL36529.1 hypothetical protein [Polyangiaceae bacterium LLY-WYZ-15_(1-7)]